MGRLIDADVLIKDGYVLHRTYQQDKETMVYETKRIENVPTAQIEPKWILCEEHLPPENTEVLTYGGYGYNIAKLQRGISKEDRKKMQKGEINDP